MRWDRSMQGPDSRINIDTCSPLQALLQRNADLEHEAAWSMSAAAAEAAMAAAEGPAAGDEAWFMEAACCRDEPLKGSHNQSYI